VAETLYPTLLLVTGLPCSGKTTLARQLAAELGFPLVTKDGIKERLFDTLGWSDRQWSRSLGGATYAILYYMIETLLASGCSLIAESNFPPDPAAQQLASLREKYPFKLLAVECIAQAVVLEERWRRRAELGTRHPGHNDAAALDEFIQDIRERTTPDGYARLGIPSGAQLVGVIDTSTRLAGIEKLVSQIRNQLKVQ